MRVSSSCSRQKRRTIVPMKRLELAELIGTIVRGAIISRLFLIVARWKTPKYFVGSHIGSGCLLLHPSLAL